MEKREASSSRCRRQWALRALNEISRKVSAVSAASRRYVYFYLRAASFERARRLWLRRRPGKNSHARL